MRVVAGFHSRARNIGRTVRQRFARSVFAIRNPRPERGLLYCSPPAMALQWIRDNELPIGGVRVHSKHAHAYPEVTGYLIPTLLDFGDKELACRLAQWLVSIQRADGSFTGHDGKPYAFDTGQVLRGLLAVSEYMPQALGAAERAVGYLSASMVDGGRGGFVRQYSGQIPESIHLYALPPMVQAAEMLGRTDISGAVDACVRFYLDSPGSLQLSTLTHFLAYELDGLIDLGRTDVAVPILEHLRRRLAANGALRGIEGKSWVCAPGLAQAAICWYKLGHVHSADLAVGWLEARQRSSGGFLGSYGRGARYFPDAELSWAAKFYLDAHRLRLVESFGREHVDRFPSEVSAQDGRAQAILEAVRPTDRVIEIGCGHGRFLAMLRRVHPHIDCWGVDISKAMLARAPDGIRCLEGCLESIPCPDESYDVVFSVEALEHSANPEAAVAEMIRIARPGGWVIVIDKQAAHWGRKDCPPWERWPELNALKKLMEKGCDRVDARAVAFNAVPASDGLMVCWRGRKRDPLCRVGRTQQQSERLQPQPPTDRIR